VESTSGVNPALRLSRFFGTRPGWWLDLQTRHDLDLATDRLEQRITRTVKPCPGLAGVEPLAA
jgi:plasmid maintenance system antidote protein VapI